MQISHTAALALGAALAGTLLAAPAFAQMRMSAPAASAPEAAASRPGDIWTGGGILFAPRYLDNPGDFEIGLGPTYVLNSSPSVPASRIAGVLGFQWKVADALEVAGLVGPVTLAGLRGPITESEYGSVGWALLYRADMYPMGTASGDNVIEKKVIDGKFPVEGLSAAPIIGPSIGVAQGGELRIDGMQKLGPVNLFAVPRVSVMSNGTRVGLGLGFDLDFDRVVVGYNWSTALNITPPPSMVGKMNTFENQHGAGGRVVLTDSLYLVANYMYVPFDAYANNVSGVLGGVGYRFGGGGGMRRSR